LDYLTAQRGWKVRFTCAADLMLAMEMAQRQNRLKDFVRTGRRRSREPLLQRMQFARLVSCLRKSRPSSQIALRLIAIVLHREAEGPAPRVNGCHGLIDTR